MKSYRWLFYPSVHFLQSNVVEIRPISSGSSLSSCITLSSGSSLSSRNHLNPYGASQVLISRNTGRTSNRPKQEMTNTCTRFLNSCRPREWMNPENEWMNESREWMNEWIQWVDWTSTDTHSQWGWWIVEGMTRGIWFHFFLGSRLRTKTSVSPLSWLVFLVKDYWLSEMGHVLLPVLEIEREEEKGKKETGTVTNTGWMRHTADRDLSWWIYHSLVPNTMISFSY